MTISLRLGPLICKGIMSEFVSRYYTRQYAHGAEPKAGHLGLFSVRIVFVSPATVITVVAIIVTIILPFRMW